MQRFLLFFMLLGLFQVSKAQQVSEFVEPCGHTAVIEHLEKKYPGFKNAYDRQYVETIKRAKPFRAEKNKFAIQPIHMIVFLSCPLCFMFFTQMPMKMLKTV